MAFPSKFLVAGFAAPTPARADVPWNAILGLIGSSWRADDKAENFQPKERSGIIPFIPLSEIFKDGREESVA